MANVKSKCFKYFPAIFNQIPFANWKLDAVIKTVIPALKCLPLNMKHPVTVKNKKVVQTNPKKRKGAK